MLHRASGFICQLIQVAFYRLHRASVFIYQMLTKWLVTSFIEPLVLFINVKQVAGYMLYKASGFN